MIETVLNITIYFSIVLPVLFLLYVFRNNKAYKYFTVYLFVIAAIQILMAIVVPQNKSNLYLFHYYFILQFIILSLFYYEILKVKWMLWILMGIASLLMLQYALVDGLYNRYNTLGAFITQLLLVVYSLIYFYRLLEQKGQFLLVNIGVLVYFTSSTLVFGLGNMVFDINVPVYISRTLNDINVFLYLGFQILIFIEWYLNYRKSRVRNNLL